MRAVWRPAPWSPPVGPVMFYRWGIRRQLFIYTVQRRLWLVPLAGGVGLLLLHRPQSSIVAPSYPPPLPPPQVPVFSPPAISILSRATQTLRDHVWEPILTAKRLFYLLTLFVPVFLTSPLLLIVQGDRWAAVWWYRLLVRQMEAAGPTFIKVSSHVGLISTCR